MFLIYIQNSSPHMVKVQQHCIFKGEMYDIFTLNRLTSNYLLYGDIAREVLILPKPATFFLSVFILFTSHVMKPVWLSEHVHVNLVGESKVLGFFLHRTD